MKDEEKTKKSKIQNIFKDINETFNPSDSAEPTQSTAPEKNDKQDLLNELETLKSQYIRLAADFDNFRKRQDQEKQELLKYGAYDTAQKLLPVLDSFDRAYMSFKTLDDPEKLKDSFEVLFRQLHEGISKINITKIKTSGEIFDPNYHEAVMQEETTEYPDNGIMMELQCGYMLGEKVIRPAMVKVASNPTTVAPCTNTEEEKK